MSLRAIFLLLLFAHLAFLGWAELIDVPPQPPPSDSISQLPRLKLLSEVRRKPTAQEPSTGAVSGTGSAQSSSAAAAPGSSTASPAAAPGSAAQPGSAVAPGSSAPASGTSASSAGSASSAAGASSGDGRAGGPGSGPSADAADPAARQAKLAVAARAVAYDPGRDARGAAASHRCIAIGPFVDPERVREATDLLTERGFTPRQRTEPSGPPHGYWVFIGGLKLATDQARIVQRLERNGISDAKAMSAADGARRVSVGLFSARDGAERRARAVRRLGLDAQIEPRQSAVTNWLDVDLASSGQSLPAEGLLSLEESGSRLEIKECPSAAPGNGSPVAPGTAGSKTPAKARPPAITPDFKPQNEKPLAAEARPRPG